MVKQFQFPFLGRANEILNTTNIEKSAVFLSAAVSKTSIWTEDNFGNIYILEAIPGDPENTITISSKITD